jgi:hypothetical protein
METNRSEDKSDSTYELTSQTFYHGKTGNLKQEPDRPGFNSNWQKEIGSVLYPLTATWMLFGELNLPWAGPAEFI